MNNVQRTDVVNFIIKDLLFGQLDLGESGFKIDELDETTLLTEPPLSLDSVDTLELVVGVERQFVLPSQELAPEALRETCTSIGTLADFVERQASRKAS
ncbi:acyl carrier protein [Breoghania sp.]|uniref:acyl carrier protein n=1 Tax=Breoghania sp. TaxID=2065378 RepID=UPI002AA8BF64|nr:acyl carrier protein [Breoghania sp.]